jgi:UPF0271 protein
VNRTLPARIDLNCDMGEGYGAWRMGDDAGVMPWISSASIACGFHAGDPELMRDTVLLARDHGVAIGAHVSFPDLQGFGRREMKLAPATVRELVLYQIGALAAIARGAGTRLAHVKPHGALYNMAARDAALAAAVAEAVREFDSDLVLYALAGSESVRAARALGLSVAEEAFCDRRYEADGSLTPRGIVGAVLDDPEMACEQAAAIVRDAAVQARDGSRVALTADTLCVHGDRSDAATFAQRLSATLRNAGVRIAAPRAA